ncbi:hypothetical protein N566_08090 [Streptomycetaceae bacterium MP113-05]|nr:hypothetical protein N566_08090 [Streptomycetaceae bacterium MP113-05]
MLMRGTRRWSVLYSDTGRLALASATPEERSAVIDFEASLAAHPHVGEEYADRAGGIRVARCDVAGRPAWTSVLYRVDEAETEEVSIVAIISGP